MTFGTNGLPVTKPWSVNLIDVPRAIAQARAMHRAGVDIVMVAVHAGDEYSHVPSAQQVAVFHALARSPYVDFVYGHHSHVVEPVERVEGKWVVYGLGNMVAEQETDDPRHLPRGDRARVFVQRPDGTYRAERPTYTPTVITDPKTYGATRVLDATALLRQPGQPPFLRGWRAAPSTSVRSIQALGRRRSRLSEVHQGREHVAHRHHAGDLPVGENRQVTHLALLHHPRSLDQGGVRPDRPAGRTTSPHRRSGGRGHRRRRGGSTTSRSETIPASASPSTTQSAPTSSAARFLGDLVEGGDGLDRRDRPPHDAANAVRGRLGVRRLCVHHDTLLGPRGDGPFFSTLDPGPGAVSGRTSPRGCRRTRDRSRPRMAVVGARGTKVPVGGGRKAPAVTGSRPAGWW